MIDVVMTATELSVFLKLAPKTVRQYARENVIPAKKLGNQWRFSKMAIDQWLMGEYSVGEQKPAGVVRTSEGNACHYSKEMTSIGSILDTKGGEYESLLEL
jgi:excisionase family DNA binding protein